MSDLAYSCEYLSAEKTCLAVLENPKAEATRKERCLSEEKLSCCYLCNLRSQCSVKCRYLGDIDNAPSVQAQIEEPKTQEPPKAPQTQPTQKPQPTVFCSTCNVETETKKAKLTLDDAQEQTLSVLAYVCPCCGKIELKANSQ